MTKICRSTKASFYIYIYIKLQKYIYFPEKMNIYIYIHVTNLLLCTQIRDTY